MPGFPLSEVMLTVSLQRFTRDGSDALEKHLAWVCDQVCRNVQTLLSQSVLEGLMLTGPYGRGEGGVLHLVNDSPCDSMDFIVFAKGSAESETSPLKQLLSELAGRLTPFAGTQITIQLANRAHLRAGTVSRETYEMVTRHRWVLGDDSLLTGCTQHLDPVRIPLDEAMSLMLDRCSNLLLARNRLYHRNFSVEDEAMVVRSFAEAQLAMGDAVLIARNEYHWSASERSLRLTAHRSPSWALTLVGHHLQGVEFQARPQVQGESRGSLVVRGQQISDLASQVWLWLEQNRLKHTFTSVRKYAHDEGSKCPSSSQIENLMFNARIFGSAGLSSRWRLRHPTERLLRTMPLLLWGNEEAEDKALVTSCFDVLPSPSSTVETYERLWRTVRGCALAA